jgi:hypothetical protein
VTLRRCLALAALLLPGCLTTAEETTLSADGTGRVRQTFTLDVEARDRLLAEALSLARPGGLDPDAAAPFARPTAPGWIRHAARGVQGYRLEKVEERVEEGREVVTVEASFTTLAAAAEAGAFLGASVRLEKTPAGEWRLSVREGMSRLLSETGGEVGGTEAAEAFAAIPSLSGWSVRRAFTLPSDVLAASEGVEVSGRRVSWTVTSEDLLQHRDHAVTFQASEDLALEPFRHEPDLDALVLRHLEAPPSEALERALPPASASDD